VKEIVMPRVSPVVAVACLSLLVCAPAEVGAPKFAETLDCRGYKWFVEHLTRVIKRNADRNTVYSARRSAELLDDLRLALELTSACSSQPAAPKAATRPPAAPPPRAAAPAAIPEDLNITEPAAPPPGAEGYAIGAIWSEPFERSLRVQFLESAAAERYAEIAGIANTWAVECEDTGLQPLVFFGADGRRIDGTSQAPETGFDVRITFKGAGHWSRVGRPPSGTDPTMSLQGFDAAPADTDERRVTILHEFGHMLGFTHEHRRREFVACLDRGETYAYYARPPNKWSQEKVDLNIFAPLPGDVMLSDRPDPTSVMVYPFPPKILLEPAPDGCVLPQPQPKISALDCAGLRSAGDAALHRQTGEEQTRVPFETTGVESYVDSGRTYYRWTIKPTRALNLRTVAAIEYDLRPYFRSGVVRARSEDGFALTRASFGHFPIKIRVTRKNGRTQEHEYRPELGDGVSSK
jgi:hypothetical protein